jgi:hypothetical protein
LSLGGGVISLFCQGCRAKVDVFFDSSQSRWAMGLLQISVVFIILSGGGCQRWCWGCRATSASPRPRGLIVIFAFLGSFLQFGRCSGLWYPFRTFLYVYVLLHYPYLVIQICTFKKSTHLYLQYTPRLVVVFLLWVRCFHQGMQQLPTFSKTAALVGAGNGSLVLHLARWGKGGSPCRSRSLSPKWKRLFCLLFESLVVSVLEMGPATFPLNYHYPALLIWSTSSKA